MVRAVILVALLCPAFSFAHNCDKFFKTDQRTDEAYACEVIPADLEVQKLHRMEVCLASVPYQPGQRYAHANYMYIDLDQYNNQFSKADGINEKYFNSFYAGLAYQAYDGIDDNKAFYEDEEHLELRTMFEGSSFLNESDSRISITINKHTGQGRFVTYNRKSAFVLKGFWNKSWDVQLQCARVR